MYCKEENEEKTNKKRSKRITMKKFKKQVKGITLIALVVTIIVLLILAGVALNLTIGQNGIFSRAQDAANTWRNAETNEQLAMQEMTDWIDGVTRVDGVPIPNGFHYAGGSKDTGLVISDNPADKKEFSEETKTEAVSNTLQGNQFVWVPVENPSNYFIDEEATLDTAATGTGEENKVTTNVYSNLTVRGGDASYYTASNPGDTTSKSVREPDVLSSYDTYELYYKTILGFDTPKAMAESFVQEYKDMSDSIKKYKGFYIGRYELTGSVDSPTEKKGASLTNQNWYNLYKACQNVVQGKENVKSTMIYGMQWDAVCSWLKQSGFDTDSNSISSVSWGNYNFPKKETGSDTKYEANGIFDLAGNCSEWTQEAYSTVSHVSRRWLLQQFRP